MIRISKKGDYAVFILGYMAQRGAYPIGGADSISALCSAQDISAQTKLQKSIVANLLKELTRAGLLESVRGIHGGYRLARSPERISLGQILRVVEGPFTLVDCTHDMPFTDLSPAALGGALSVRNHATLLPLARSEANPRSGHASQPADAGCRLEGHCPSRSPMRVLHERIQGLIDSIMHPELCGLRPKVHACSTPNFTNP